MWKILSTRRAWIATCPVLSMWSETLWRITATKRTTPLLEPVTGRVGHVGAPLRQPPPNADTIPGPPLKQRLRAQLRFQVNRRRIIEEAKLMAGAE